MEGIGTRGAKCEIEKREENSQLSISNQLELGVVSGRGKGNSVILSAQCQPRHATGAAEIKPLAPRPSPLTLHRHLSNNRPLILAPLLPSTLYPQPSAHNTSTLHGVGVA
eukprot:scaffold6967_cov123-Isochrysis_galbana.AAC.5